MFWNNTKRPASNDDGKKSCRHCEGRGFNRQKEIYLQTMCIYCSGRGCLDWIDHMTGNPSPNRPDYDFQRDLTIQNVHVLIHEIKVMLSRVGIHATVDVREHGPPDFERVHQISKLMELEPNINSKLKTILSI